MLQNSYKMRIVLALLKSENHVRGLARTLGTNQTNIARKVQELSRENIVDFKQEGRNKVVFIKKTLEGKQYVYAAEMQKLVEVIKKYPSLRRIVELIKKNENIKMAILFGSYAKNAANKKSDIDIYIDTADGGIKREVELIDSKINAKIGKYSQSSLLIKEIDKNHAIIKGVELYYEKNKFFNETS